MNLTELRIGNFINHFGRIYQVKAFSKDMVTFDLPKSDELPSGGEFSNYAHNIEPVKITVEWLEKMGFVESLPDIFTLVLDDPIELHYVICAFEPFLEWKEKESIPIPTEIHYVHQLQNLVFALTGEELEVKGGHK